MIAGIYAIQRRRVQIVLADTTIGRRNGSGGLPKKSLRGKAWALRCGFALVLFTEVMVSTRIRSGRLGFIGTERRAMCFLRRCSPPTRRRVCRVRRLRPRRKDAQVTDILRTWRKRFSLCKAESRPSACAKTANSRSAPWHGPSRGHHRPAALYESSAAQASVDETESIAAWTRGFSFTKSSSAL